MILALEIAEDVYEIFQAFSYKPEPEKSTACTALVRYQGIDLDQIELEDYLQEVPKMNFLKRIGSFIKEIFAEDYDTEGLITPFGVVSI